MNIHKTSLIFHSEAFMHYFFYLDSEGLTLISTFQISELNNSSQRSFGKVHI